MEHRSGARTSLNLEARIHLSRRGTVPARVRDISMGGMRVNAAGHFRVHQQVVVEFAFPRDDHCRRWRAAIVYVGADGIGLMFDGLRLNELATLRKLLHVDS